jgi:2-phosphosulfolactate phosphatase
VIGTVVIDCFPESAARYRGGYAVVAIDVVRATTTAITAVALGRRCFPVASVDAAFAVAAKLDKPLLAGEQRGIMPPGFDINNSPAVLATRADVDRPLVLLSSSGTRLCHTASQCDVAFLACLRNYASMARYLAGRFAKIAVIGAGTRNEFREEDEMCCAWIADILINAGYKPENPTTAESVERWRGARIDSWIGGKSAAFLRNSGQLDDLHFILDHVDDLPAVFCLQDGEVIAKRGDRTRKRMRLRPLLEAGD